MLPEIDEALRALVRADAARDESIVISFEAPTKEWAARRVGPAISIYLYDIREQLNQRGAAMVMQRADDGRMQRRPPARRFQLAYLVSAWTARPEDEHRLLSSCLGAFLRTPVLQRHLLPADYLEDEPLPTLMVGQPASDSHKISDVWPALGGELKPSLDVTISASFDTGRRYDLAAPVTEPTTVHMHPEGPAEAVARAGALTKDAVQWR